MVFARLCRIDTGENKGNISADFDGIIVLLYREGANINSLDCPKKANGWSPMHYASKYGCYDRVKWLLDRHAEVNIRNIHEQTPLMLACMGGYLDVIILLVKHNADTGAFDVTDKTPLHFAAISGRKLVVEFLLACGCVADKTKCSKDGLSPIEICRRGGLIDCVEILQKAVFPNQSSRPLIEALTKDNKSWTAQMIGSRGGKHEVGFKVSKGSYAGIRGSIPLPKTTKAQWKLHWSRMGTSNNCNDQKKSSQEKEKKTHSHI